MGSTRWEMPEAPPEAWPRAPIVAPPVPPHPPAPKRLGPRGWLAISALVVAGLLTVAAVLAAVVPDRSDPGAAADDVAPTLVADDLTAPRVVGGCCLVALGLDAVVGLTDDATQATWRTPCAIPGWASPVDSPSADVAVVTCDDDLVGLDGRSGERLWERPAMASTRLRVGPAAVVVQSDEDGVTALDLDTGEVAVRLDRPLSVEVASDDAHLYLADDATVTARDLDTGEIVWSVSQPSSGLLATDEAVFARTDQHEVLRLDPATGDTVARSGAMDPERLAWSDVVAASDEVVVLRSTRPPYRTVVYDAGDLGLLWEEEAVAARPIGAGGGVVVLVDPQTGRLVVHDERSGEDLARIDDAGAVNPAVLGDAVVFASRDPEGRLGVEAFR